MAVDTEQALSIFRCEEQEKAEKYDAIGTAKKREAYLRRFVMVTKSKMDHAIKPHYMEEDRTLMKEPVDAASVHREVQEIISDLRNTMNKIFEKHNDIVCATYLSVCHWWYEVFDDFVLYIDANSKYYIYEREDIDKILNTAGNSLRKWGKP